MFNLVENVNVSVGSTINVNSLKDFYVAECLNGFATLQRQFKVSYNSFKSKAYLFSGGIKRFFISRRI